MDLHARHRFTRAAAVDGSLKEEVVEGKYRRSLAYGVYEGIGRGGGAGLRRVITHLNDN